MKTDIAAELQKYSKTALINAFLNTNLFSSELLLKQVKYEEFKIISKKQYALMEEIKKTSPITNLKKYMKLSDTYMRYSKQTDKLLDL